MTTTTTLTERFARAQDLAASGLAHINTHAADHHLSAQAADDHRYVLRGVAIHWTSGGVVSGRHLIQWYGAEFPAIAANLVEYQLLAELTEA